MNRRQVLRGLGAGSLVLIAGCGDGGGSGNGSDGDGDGSSGGGSAGGEGGSGASDELTTTAPETTTAGNVTGRTTTEADGPDLPSLERTIALEPNWRWRADLSNYHDVNSVLEGRWVDGDLAYNITSSGTSATFYHVGGEFYVVVQGRCVSPSQVPSVNFDADRWADPGNTDEQLGDLGAARPVRTDAIDGEQMYVYSLDPPTQEIQGPVEYWVSASTGHPRRFVSPDGMDVEYWDWGEVNEPVDPPC